MLSARSSTSKGEDSSRRRSSWRRVTEKTSNGPQKSSTSTLGKMRMPTRLRVMEILHVSRDSETMAVLGGVHAHRAQKCPAHGLGASEAALHGDRIEVERRLFEMAPGRFDACELDESGRGHPDLAGEHPREMALAHHRAPSERRYGEIGIGMLADPHLQLAEGHTVGGLSRQLGAVLRLATWSLEEHDELPSDRQGDLPSMIFLDQRQGEVHPGGDAGRGVDRTVSDEDRVGLDPDPRILPGEFSARAPVGRGATPVEEAGLGEHEGTGADRGETPHTRSDPPEPAYQLGAWRPAG